MLNELNWQLKQVFHYSRRFKTKPRLDLIKTLHNLTPQQRSAHERLYARYNMFDWPSLCNQSEYLENLYILSVLDQHLDSGQHPFLGPGLDLGCRNFSHLPALKSFRPHPWHGIELDAHARYWSGHTRRAHGEWMAAQHPGSQYLPTSLLSLPQGPQYNFISWWLPFVTEQSLRYWGLPRRFFQPHAMLSKAIELLCPGGTLFIANQGAHEASLQAALFRDLHLHPTNLGELVSPLSPFQHPRYGWLYTKP